MFGRNIMVHFRVDFPKYVINTHLLVNVGPISNRVEVVMTNITVLLYLKAYTGSIKLSPRVPPPFAKI